MTNCKNCKYTDEYCASGDCNKIQANDLACNKISLTEQWKKGELKEGYYYVKDGENMIAEYLDGYFYNDGNPMTSFSGGVDEVIAPVPSYEKWKAKLEENEQLKERVSKLEKMQYSYTPEEWNTMLRTVNRTKELLKRAKIILEDEGDYMIVQEIDEALR